jgi:hypothetical protein
MIPDLNTLIYPTHPSPAHELVSYINSIILKMLLLRGTKTFSTSAAIAQKTFTKFTERYTANIQEFQKRVASTAVEGEQLKRSTLRAYVHPYNDPHKRVISGVAETLRSESELRGA